MKKLTLLLISLTFLNLNLSAQSEPLKSVKGSIKKVMIYADSSMVIPGKVFSVGVELFTDKGTGKTKGMLNGEISWKEFDFKIIGGTYDLLNPGIITVSEKQSDFVKDHVQVDVFLKKDSSFLGQLNVPVLYRVEKTFKYYGISGAPGNVGKDGSFKDDGNGVPDWGGHGGKGSKGPRIEVHVEPFIINGDTIIQAKILNTSDRRVDIIKIDPKGGKLIIYSIGGQGGVGGQGGAGARSHSDCVNTNGAPGGVGGDGGEGGEIVFFIDSSLTNCQNLLLGYSLGGKEGYGGYGGKGKDKFYCKWNEDPSKNGYSNVGIQGPQGRDGRTGEAGPEPQYIVE